LPERLLGDFAGSLPAQRSASCCSVMNHAPVDLVFLIGDVGKQLLRSQVDDIVPRQ
jgi:hypothetical protein